jgi:hypothetical protein
MRPRKVKPRRLIARPSESEHPETESKPLALNRATIIHKEDFIIAKFELKIAFISI